MIHLVLEGLPPSSNAAYFNLPKGGRVLTKAGKKYIAETKDHLARNYMKELTFFKKDAPYLVVFRFYLGRVQNAEWATGKAESRYKRIDVTNRVKLLEDCLKEVAGIDDSQHMRVILDKQEGAERTEIWVWDMEEEETPFDAGFNTL
jgi:hypothetical protein